MLVAACLWGVCASNFAAEDGAVSKARQPPVAADPYQRSVAIYTFRSFPGERGKELYFYTCWVCHNEYTNRDSHPPVAPLLTGLFNRPVLITGEALSEASVKQKIRLGGPGMPGFGAMFSEAQLADLVAYLKSRSCCWDENNPPPNPAYRGSR